MNYLASIDPEIDDDFDEFLGWFGGSTDDSE